MSTAWSYIWYIFDKFVNFIFNETIISDSGATVGWVAVTVFIFGILIRSLLNLPKRSRRVSADRLSNNKDD